MWGEGPEPHKYLGVRPCCAKPKGSCRNISVLDHSPSTIPAVALITSEDIYSAPPPPGHLNVHRRLP
ncbi:hypothetical protein I79_005535 [Cricetulus griseus]|uniref:Uncharacterized protein n=1 Tax=Cricetulus griseus TaxID=10029 RepID=G3H5F4_CRIGR|nr:hypothetical protein I79_005535 [Cricetulus griseus]